MAFIAGAAIIGGGVGLGKFGLDMGAYGRKKGLAVTTARYSPWTGLKAEMPDEPNILGDVMGGVSSGLGTANSINKMGQSNQIFDLTKTGLDNYNKWFEANQDKPGFNPNASSQVNVGPNAGSSWAPGTPTSAPGQRMSLLPPSPQDAAGGGFSLMNASGPAPMPAWASSASMYSPQAATAGLQAPASRQNWPVIGVTDSGAAIGGSPQDPNSIRSNANGGLKAGTTASGTPPPGVNYSSTGMNGGQYRVEAPGAKTNHPMDPNSSYVWDPVTNTYKLKSQ